MECKKCGKEITLDDGVVYCPYCGAKLKGEEAPKTRNILLRELKVGDRLKEFIVWLLLCGIFVAFFIVLKKPFFSERFALEIPELPDWRVIASIVGSALYFTLAYVVYNHAKKYHRRAVAWATAFIVFTPILGGLAYLLSWPKE